MLDETTINTLSETKDSFPQSESVDTPSSEQLSVPSLKVHPFYHVEFLDKASGGYISSHNGYDVYVVEQNKSDCIVIQNPKTFQQVLLPEDSLYAIGTAFLQATISELESKYFQFGGLLFCIRSKGSGQAEIICKGKTDKLSRLTMNETDFEDLIAPLTI